MFLRLHTQPVVQIGGGTDATLPVYRCQIRTQPIQSSDTAVSNSTITILQPGSELRAVLASAPVGVAAELCEDDGEELFAGAVQSVSFGAGVWSVVVEA
jgi:hypothetical protein